MLMAATKEEARNDTGENLQSTLSRIKEMSKRKAPVWQCEGV